MASISVGGLGSGLDINGLLDQIVEAERAPIENRLNLQEAELQAELTAFGSLKSAVSSFQSSLGSLKSSSTFTSTLANVGNPDLLTAYASSIAEAGSYSVEVANLAQSHSLASIAFDSLDDVIGSGTLTFNFGTTTYTEAPLAYSFIDNPDRSSESIVIDNTNNSVQGIRDAINDADIGITASIVDNGTGYRLLITSDQAGFDNSVQIVVDEGGAVEDNEDDTGLSQLAFNSDATNAEQTQAAQDAEIFVNGLQIFRETNTVAGAIHGVTLNLLAIDPGQPTQISISRNNADAESNIANFVNAYNDLVNTVNGLTEYDPDAGVGGILQGDSAARNILNQIRRELGNSIANGSAYTSLASIGITTNNDGTLGLDSNKLASSIQDDVDAVASLFYATATATDSGVSYLDNSSVTQEGTYAVNITTLATQGSLAGENVAGAITIDVSNESFSLLVNGISTGVISLTQAVYNDLNDLAQEMQNRLNASSSMQSAGINLEVSYTSGHFEISSSSYGSESSVSVASQNATLGLTSNAIETVGMDVVGSIGNNLATGSGQILVGEGEAAGLQLSITGNTTGNRGSINFTRGIAGELDALLANFLDSAGLFNSKTDSINNQIDDIAGKRETLYKRVAAIEARYRTQFVALDVLMGQLQITSDYLAQQLESLPKIQVNK